MDNNATADGAIFIGMGDAETHAAALARLVAADIIA